MNRWLISLLVTSLYSIVPTLAQYTPGGGGSGSGTVTTIHAGTGITCTPNPITGVGTISANGSSGGFLLTTLTNGDASSAPRGTVVYITSNNTFDFAQANSASTINVIGLVSDSSIASGVSGNILTSGALTATTGQWDAVVTGESGGLTAGTRYFLDPSNPGKLTITPPGTSGNYVVPIGIALSTTQMLVNIGTSVLL